MQLSEIAVKEEENNTQCTKVGTKDVEVPLFYAVESGGEEVCGNI